MSARINLGCGLIALAGVLTAQSLHAEDDSVTVPRASVEQMQATQQATEQMAAEMMKAERDWRAQAIRLDGMVSANKQKIAAMEAELEKARKACPTPAEPPK